MFTSTDLKKIITESRPIIERQLDDALTIAGFRTKVTDAGGDWGQVKALLKAMIQDERDEAGGNKRVTALLAKADHATAYADMLGLGNLNENNYFETADRELIRGEAPTNPAPATGAKNALVPEAVDQSTGVVGERHSREQITATEAPPVEPIAAPAQTGAQSSLAGVEGDADRPPLSDAAKNALRLRPHCQAALRDEITKCGGYGKVTCFDCSKAHADAEGETA